MDAQECKHCRCSPLSCSQHSNVGTSLISVELNCQTKRSFGVIHSLPATTSLLPPIPSSLARFASQLVRKRSCTSLCIATCFTMPTIEWQLFIRCSLVEAEASENRTRQNGTVAQVVPTTKMSNSQIPSSYLVGVL